MMDEKVVDFQGELVVCGWLSTESRLAIQQEASARTLAIDRLKCRRIATCVPSDVHEHLVYMIFP